MDNQLHIKNASELKDAFEAQGYISDKDLLNIAYGVEQKLGFAGQIVGGKHE